MTIIIVEDNSLKASKLVGLIGEECGSTVIPLVYASYQSGLRAIEAGAPSLILMDMTLPTFDRKPNSREGRARPLGGYEIMRKMLLKGIDAQVVVVSQLESFGEDDEEVGFSDLMVRCREEFPGIFLDGVYFDQDDVTWREELRAVLRAHVK